MKLGIILYHDAEELDIVGPWEMLSTWSLQYGGPETCITLSEDGRPVRCAKGLKLVPDCSFADCPELDVLLIPGGRGTFTELENEVFMTFVREQAKRCRTILTVCTASFILERIGLLAGLPATTYWSRLDALKAGNVGEVKEERFLLNASPELDIWTSAGVSAGIDMSLAFIERSSGADVASKVQLYTEYYPSTKRYGTEHLQAYAPAYASAAE